MGADVQNTGGKRQPKRGEGDANGGFGLADAKRTIGYVQKDPKPSGSQRNNKDD